MVYFKSCIRCKGDVHLNRDWFGDFLECLQCGWTRDVSTEPSAGASQPMLAGRMQTVQRRAS